MLSMYFLEIYDSDALHFSNIKPVKVTGSIYLNDQLIHYVLMFDQIPCRQIELSAIAKYLFC